MSEEIVDYKRLYENEKKKNETLAKIVSYYETDGIAKLFYALNRKCNELANLLNANSLDDSTTIGDKDNKMFDRVFKILEKSETVSNSIKSLGELAGVTGDEDKDTKKRTFTSRLAQTRTE
jgi:hypothetical protein